MTCHHFRDNLFLIIILWFYYTSIVNFKKYILRRKRPPPLFCVEGALIVRTSSNSVPQTVLVLCQQKTQHEEVGVAFNVRNRKRILKLVILLVQ